MGNQEEKSDSTDDPRQPESASEEEHQSEWTSDDDENKAILSDRHPYNWEEQLRGGHQGRNFQVYVGGFLVLAFVIALLVLGGFVITYLIEMFEGYPQNLLED